MSFRTSQVGVMLMLAYAASLASAQGQTTLTTPKNAELREAQKKCAAEMPSGRVLNNKPTPLSPAQRKEYMDECVSVALMSPEQRERLRPCGHTADSFYSGVARTRAEFNKFVDECVSMKPWTVDSLAIFKGSAVATSHHEAWLDALAREYLLYQRSRCQDLSLQSIVPVHNAASAPSGVPEGGLVEEWRVLACGKPTILRLTSRPAAGGGYRVKPEIRPE